MNRREFFKAFSAGTTWIATISFTDIIGAKPTVNMVKKSPELDLIVEDEDILDVTLKTDGLVGEALLDGDDVLTLELSIDGQSIMLSDIQMDEVIRQYNYICNP